MVRRILVYGLAVVLCAAGVLKLIGILGLGRGIAPIPASNGPVLPDGLVAAIAVFEILLAIWLLRSPESGRGRVVAAVFLTLATVFALVLRMNEIPLSACGCFGPLSDPMAGAHLAVNGILLLAAGYLVLAQPEV